MKSIKAMTYLLILSTLFMMNCKKDKPEDIKGYNLLSEINGHWVGSNETPFGNFSWFVFDFRPISASHTHYISESATNQNIITSFFIAKFDGKLQVMARNGGWLGPQYRATYFVLDKAEESANSKYYRLVDAVGGIDRSYMELRFENDSLYFDAYKDNSGTLDQPIHHMGFKGGNINPSYSENAISVFNYPQAIEEVDLEDKFANLIDDNSALFLEKADDPFPKESHGYISELTVDINRDAAIASQSLVIYLSKKSIVDASGNVNLANLNATSVRVVTVQDIEDEFTFTYLHPDSYFITAFSHADGDFIPSSGDYINESKALTIDPESNSSTSIDIGLVIP